VDERQQIRWVTLAPGAHINGPGIFRLDSSFCAPPLSRTSSTSLLVCPTDSETTSSLSNHRRHRAPRWLSGSTVRPTACAAATVVREVVVADYLPTPPSAVSSSISSYLQLHITPPQPCQHPIFTRIAPQPQAKSPAVRRQRPSTASIQPPLVPQAAAPISLRKPWHPHTAAAQ